MLITILNENPHDFLYHQEISFSFNPSPVISDFFLIEKVHSEISFYIIQKTGHIIGFGVLYGLLVLSFRNRRWAFVLSIAFAFTTEGLQLYFNRTGRLTDVGIDFIGILIIWWISLIVMKKRK